MGRILVQVGLLIAALGVVVMGLERLNIGLGRLPGDIVMRSKNTTVYFPIVTCILLSLAATLLMWLFNRR